MTRRQYTARARTSFVSLAYRLTYIPNQRIATARSYRRLEHDRQEFTERVIADERATSLLFSAVGAYKHFLQHLPTRAVSISLCRCSLASANVPDTSSCQRHAQNCYRAVVVWRTTRLGLECDELVAEIEQRVTQLENVLTQHRRGYEAYQPFMYTTNTELHS
jgi:hypothetical protein